MEKNLIKVIVYPKTRKTKKGVKFTTYSTTMNLIDEEGELVKKSVNVKFSEDVDKKLILTTPMLLDVEEKNISAPTRYIVKEETNDEGELIKKYPVVWINKIESSATYKTPVKQSQFVVNDILEDDEETEINNDNSPF